MQVKPRHFGARKRACLRQINVVQRSNFYLTAINSVIDSGRKHMRIKLLATAALAALVTAMPAQAAAGDWLVRLRAILVAPNDSSGPVTPTFPTAGVSVNNSYAPEVDFTYMATDHIGAELILATTKHSASGTGALAPVGKLAST